MALEDHLREFRRRDKLPKHKRRRITGRAISEIVKPIEDFIVAEKVEENLKKKTELKALKKGRPHPNLQAVLDKYGITREFLDTLLNNQLGRCAICMNPSIKLLVDHNHANGNVRGLLCSHCNSVLGFARDNATVLKNAISYLETNIMALN